MPKPSIVVLVSGGLDSSVLLSDLSHRYASVWPVYIRQGLAWEKIELYWLNRFLKKLPAKNLKLVQILDVPMGDVYGKHWSTGGRAVPGPRSKDSAVFLPGRNLVLTVKTAVFAAMHGISDIAIGSLGHNPFPDARPRFFKVWGRALSSGIGKQIRVVAPYRQTEKWELIKRARRVPLELTFSCIAPRGKQHCGHCNKCIERIKAFKKAGVQDETAYA